MDDIATGGSPSQVKKMAGKRQNSQSKFETNGTLPAILSKGALHLKAVVTSGEQDEEVLDKLGNSVLGINWDASSDLISIEMESPTMLETMVSIGNINELSLTMRKLLKIISKPHDILGLLTPITIRVMVAYRDLFRIEPTLGWDYEIPTKKKQKWVQILCVFHEVSSIK